MISSVLPALNLPYLHFMLVDKHQLHSPSLGCNMMAWVRYVPSITGPGLSVCLDTALLLQVTLQTAFHPPCCGPHSPCHKYKKSRKDCFLQGSGAGLFLPSIFTYKGWQLIAWLLLKRILSQLETENTKLAHFNLKVNRDILIQQ